MAEPIEGDPSVRLTDRLAAAVLAGALALSGALVSAPPAAAAPSIEQVRDRLQELQFEAEAATEDYNKAQADLDEIEADLVTLRERIRRERKELREILGTVDDLARSTYATGGIDASLQVLMADDPTQFLAQASALDQVAASQASALRQSKTARLRLAQAEAELEQKEDQAERKRDAMREAKERADDRFAEQQRILDGLEAEQLARLAALDRQQAADSRREANEVARNLPSSTGGGFSGGGRAMQAVRYALDQVGDRYVRAASGPSAFDCSGLTLRAWSQAGVSLPHYSVAQFQTTRRIPLSEARPGDLVFYFGGGTKHVGMYIGNGKMVHAANPRIGVVISPVLGSWYSSKFSGVGRVVG